MEAALVLCEGKFGTYTGKTANGLVRHSEGYKILGIVDSTNEGKDAGEVLDGKNRNIPIFKDLAQALKILTEKPQYLIIGVATIGGMLPEEFRPIIKAAISKGIHIISGLHEFLNDDEEFFNLSKKYNVSILDIRKQPPLKELHSFKNLVKDIDAFRIAILGTDSSIGKRTIAIELTQTLKREAIKAVFIATGQTGLLQGARYGIAIDSIQSDYMVGELENAVMEAYKYENPQVIIVEGQGSISHPAYVCGTRAIITASQPNCIILQHAPKRRIRNYHREEQHLPMPNLRREIEMLELFSKAKVIAITINPEHMSDKEVNATIEKYERDLGVPACDVLKHGCRKLVDKIREIIEGSKCSY
jgi:uncharacterized NAD-dependent epimerase/dehydratase family protein